MIFFEKVKKTVALVGNPNCGKSTLFNVLTKSHQHVGNWAGVTVEKKEGKLFCDQNITVIDLPGVYSLTPFSLDEQVVSDYLASNSPDLIINVVDSTNLERSLFLTTQLLEKPFPVVVALNMYDELTASGDSIDCEKLRSAYGCKFIPLSAKRSLGVDELLQYVNEKDKFPSKPLNKKSNDPEKVAYESYKQISQTLKSAYIRKEIKPKHYYKPTFSDKMDAVLTNKWLAFPIFALVMLIIFQLAIGGIGSALTNLFNEILFPKLIELVGVGLSGCRVWLQSLILDGILRGVLSIVAFAPQIMLLFGCISILEESGYMARVAFITDRLLYKVGLGGRSFVSMLLGCGCSVPAIMSTRTIKNLGERNATIILSPFVPCSAKVALFSFFTAEIFGGNSLVATSMYFVSILSVILGGLLLKVFRRKTADASEIFLMELPPYRLPQAKSVAIEMWNKGKSFLIKAGTVIFTASVVLWVLTRLDGSFNLVAVSDSIIAQIGKAIAPIFAPLGFGRWEFAVATISGITAKETVVTTLKILFDGKNLSAILSPLATYSFMTFNLLCAPCITAISASFRELGKVKQGLFAVMFQTSLAYIVSLAIYQIGSAIIRM